ncbi:hypothetical protein EZV77_25655 [Burkholderia thailandensis]|nr:hypothetical protein AQ475_04995 [Burkholderia thailandensis]AVR11456.1 hypothetical protein A8H31_30900 [Burkholderia thailandensis]AVR25669.1 hypothetical protein A8H32_11555 [Burkholderia thailandensis]AWY58957.1 hypothetical protein A8H35_11510 [Burkholderia thailandensis]AWY66874.1 hypothetical protein A8H36_16925 [Burkholderia thailandensis]
MVVRVRTRMRVNEARRARRMRWMRPPTDACAVHERDAATPGSGERDWFGAAGRFDKKAGIA